MQELRIIYVDDERIGVSNFLYTVADCEYIASVDTFYSPHEALAHAKENPVDMAFLDVDLGSVDGFWLCEKLREIYPNLPVAFVTGNIAYMDKTRRVVEASYIFKPYGRGEIVTALLEKM